jgi:hypothetical protein
MPANSNIWHSQQGSEYAAKGVPRESAAQPFPAEPTSVATAAGGQRRATEVPPVVAIDVALSAFDSRSGSKKRTVRCSKHTGSTTASHDVLVADFGSLASEAQASCKTGAAVNASFPVGAAQPGDARYCCCSEA